MATRAAIRNRVRRLIRDLPQQDTLASGITAGSSSITLTRGYSAGAPMLWEIGSEIVDVGTWDAGTKTGATLTRGAFGSTAAEADAGAVVYFNPRITVLDYNEAINSAIRRMNAARLYQVDAFDITYNASIAGYALETDVVGVAEVRADNSGPENDWPIVKQWDLVRDLPTSDFASSGIGIVLRGNRLEAGRTVRVKQMKNYSLFSDDSADSSTLGIQSFAEDLIAYGAASEIFGTEEAGRTQIDTAVEAQRAQDVPPRHRVTAAQVLEAKFQQRLAEARRELQKLYPITHRKVI